jgi:uncharacterized protein
MQDMPKPPFITPPSRAGIGWRHAHYQDLLEAKPTLGFIEVHSENFFGAGGAALAVLDQGRAAYPLSLHGVGLGLGSAVGLDAWHLGKLARLVERTEPWLVSDHACFARGASHHASDLLPVPFNAVSLDVMCSHVQQVQGRLKRPIAVENISAYFSWQVEASDGDAAMDEPTFLTTVSARTGCGLLIDVNNIYVNALNQRRGARFEASVSAVDVCRAWLNTIPPAAVAEIHLAGHVDCGDIVIDDHGSRTCEAVWDLYAHAIARFGPVPTLIEWDTDVPALDVLLSEAARADQVAQCRVHSPAQ